MGPQQDITTDLHQQPRGTGSKRLNRRVLIVILSLVVAAGIFVSASVAYVMNNLPRREDYQALTDSKTALETEYHSLSTTLDAATKNFISSDAVNDASLKQYRESAAKIRSQVDGLAFNRAVRNDSVVKDAYAQLKKSSDSYSQDVTHFADDVAALHEIIKSVTIVQSPASEAAASMRKMAQAIRSHEFQSSTIREFTNGIAHLYDDMALKYEQSGDIADPGEEVRSLLALYDPFGKSQKAYDDWKKSSDMQQSIDHFYAVVKEKQK